MKIWHWTMLCRKINSVIKQKVDNWPTLLRKVPRNFGNGRTLGQTERRTEGPMDRAKTVYPLLLRSGGMINSLPDNKILDQSKSKTFAGN